METIVAVIVALLQAHPATGAALITIAGVLALLAPALYLAQPWLQKKVKATPTNVDNVLLDFFYAVIDKLTPKSAKRGSETSPEAKVASVYGPRLSAAYPRTVVAPPAKKRSSRGTRSRRVAPPIPGPTGVR